MTPRLQCRKHVPASSFFRFSRVLLLLLLWLLLLLLFHYCTVLYISARWSLTLSHRGFVALSLPFLPPPLCTLRPLPLYGVALPLSRLSCLQAPPVQRTSNLARVGDRRRRHPVPVRAAVESSRRDVGAAGVRWLCCLNKGGPFFLFVFRSFFVCLFVCLFCASFLMSCRIVSYHSVSYCSVWCGVVWCGGIIHSVSGVLFGHFDGRRVFHLFR